MVILTENFFISSEREFNEIFRKDVLWDNNKSHKKQGFTLSLEETFFEKPQGVGVNLNPPLRMRKHIKSIKSKNNFNLLLPNLIIVTFIALIIIPNLLIGAVTCGLISFNEILCYLFYKTGFLLDPLIYIFNSRLERIICYKVKPVTSWWKG